jgi:hypothetical protein
MNFCSKTYWEGEKLITVQQFKPARIVTAFMLTVLLSACGGGGGGESPSAGAATGNAGAQSPATGTNPAPALNPVPAGFESITTLAKQAVANAKYFVQTIKAVMTDEVVIALPTSIAVGGTVQVRGGTDIRWKLAQSAGQTIGTRALPGGVEPGLTFTPQQSTTQNWWFVASSASGQKLAAVANNFPGLQNPNASASSSGLVWTSADAGATWTVRMAPGDAPWSSIASSADGTKLVAVGVGTQIWTSGDSGVTWLARDSAREWDSVTMSADGSRIAAATLETIAGSSDGRIYTLAQAPGAAFGEGNWVPQTEVQMWRSIASSADGRKLVAAAHRDGATSPQAGVFTSDNYGVTWTPRTTPAVTAYRVASSADGTRLAMVERFGKIYTSADSGLTWSAGAFEGGFNSVASSADGSVLVAVQANGTNPITEPAPPAGRTGRLLVSTNSGATWTERATPSKWWRGAAVSADGNRLVGAVNVGQIYVSTSNRSSYGTTGSITGGQTNEVTLRYLGDGLFDVTSASGSAYVTR